MDTRTGEIFELDELKKHLTVKEFEENYIEMKVAPTQKQLKRRPPKVGRNELCPCGSGLKLKKCCLKNI